MEIASEVIGVEAPSIHDVKPLRVFVITSSGKWESSRDLRQFRRWAGECEFTDTLSELDSCQVGLVVEPLSYSAKRAILDYFFSRKEALVYQWVSHRNAFVFRNREWLESYFN